MTKRSVAIGLAAFVLLLVAYTYLPNINKPVTQLARISTLENKISAPGYLIKNERLIKAEQSGELHSLMKDGDRVKKEAKVASVLQGAVDPGVQAQLDQIDARLAEIKKEGDAGLTGDATHVERVLKEKITDVARCVQAEEIGQLPQLKYEINRLLAVKYKKDDAPENESDLLKAQKQQLEAQLGASKEELTAPIAGVYSSVVDGYEAYLNYNAATSLTPEDFTGLENLNPEPPKTPACKVIDNFAWRIVILVPAESVEQVSVGGSVRLRFNSVSQNLYSAKVLAKNQSGKSVALVLECTEELVELADKRRLDVDLVFERYEGYQIPLKAVHIKDGKEGVYIQSGGATKFREITVLYKNDSFVIALSDNQKENNVLLYDEIILSDKGIPQDTP